MHTLCVVVTPSKSTVICHTYTSIIKTISSNFCVWLYGEFTNIEKSLSQTEQNLTDLALFCKQMRLLDDLSKYWVGLC